MKTLDFLETSAASDLTFGRSRHIHVIQLNEGMCILKVKGLMSCTYKKSNRIFSGTTVLF